MLCEPQLIAVRTRVYDYGLYIIGSVVQWYKRFVLGVCLLITGRYGEGTE